MKCWWWCFSTEHKLLSFNSMVLCGIPTVESSWHWSTTERKLLWYFIFLLLSVKISFSFPISFFLFFCWFLYFFLLSHIQITNTFLFSSLFCMGYAYVVIITNIWMCTLDSCSSVSFKFISSFHWVYFFFSQLFQW